MRAGLSLYDAKPLLRRALDRAPALRRLPPNAVTLAILPAGALLAAALAAGMWPLAAAGCALRMLLATLDGYLASTTGRATATGGYLNRAVPQLADALLALGLWPHAGPGWALAVATGIWLVEALGSLGAVAGGSVQLVGPGAQADRLAVLLAAAVLASFVPIDWQVVAALLVALLAVTAVLRTRRTLRELGSR